MPTLILIILSVDLTLDKRVEIIKPIHSVKYKYKQKQNKTKYKKLNKQTTNIMSDYEQAMILARRAGITHPESPQPMTSDEVTELSRKMVLDLMKLMSTAYGPQTGKDRLMSLVRRTAFSHDGEFDNDTHKTAYQAEILSDLYGSVMTSSCESGIDLSAVVETVHEAKMDQYDPRAHRSLKAIPDIEKEIIRQQNAVDYDDASDDDDAPDLFAYGSDI